MKALHAITGTPIDLAALEITTETPLLVYKLVTHCLTTGQLLFNPFHWSRVQGTTHIVLPPKDGSVVVKGGEYDPKATEADPQGAAPATKELEELQAVVKPYDNAQIVEQLKNASDSMNQAPASRGSDEVHNLEPGGDVAFYKK